MAPSDSVRERSGHPTPEIGERVRWPVMYQSWNLITFLHWRYEPAVIQRLLPPPLQVQTFDGAAWVGLTPFLLENLRSPVTPPLPWISRSPETNVRTYVLGPDGRSGIWFFSLDIARLPAVVAARAAYRLPYMWASLGIERSGDRITYEGQRRWPDVGARYRIEIERGRPLDRRERDPLEDFLTERRILFTFYGSVAASASTEHPPWPLWSGRLLDLDQTLLAAADIPPPTGEAVVHFSPGVDTRISRPRLILDRANR